MRSCASPDRGAFHWAAVIRMQDQGFETPLLGQARLAQHLGGAGRILLGEDFPADHLAREQVQHQVEVVVGSGHRAWQPRDVPHPDGISPAFFDYEKY